MSVRNETTVEMKASPPSIDLFLIFQNYKLAHGHCRPIQFRLLRKSRRKWQRFCVACIKIRSREDAQGGRCGSILREARARPKRCTLARCNGRRESHHFA